MESSILNSIGIDPGNHRNRDDGDHDFRIALYGESIDENDALHEALSHFHEGKGCRVP